MASFGEYFSADRHVSAITASAPRSSITPACARAQNVTTKRYRRPATGESPVLYACGLHRQSEIFHHEAVATRTLTGALIRSGLCEVFRVALSLAMTAMVCIISDIGGYTTLFDYETQQELAPPVLVRFQRLYADDAPIAQPPRHGLAVRSATRKLLPTLPA